MTTNQELTVREIAKFRKLTRFTTGQVAKICKVAPRTVSKWIDDPEHRYFFAYEIYRLPPTTPDGAPHDRRVTRAGLIRFLIAREMFTHLAVLQGLSRIIYAGNDRRPCQDALGSDFDVIPAHCPFDLARLITRDVPPLIIVDFGNPGAGLAPCAVCGDIRAHFGAVSAGGPRILGLCVRDSADQACVDDFVLNIENLRHRVRVILPEACADTRMAG